MTDPVLEKRFVQTSFGKIAYLEVGGDDRPPVLFVHGIPTSSYLWRHVLRFLQNDFHCYAPDLMGLGDTQVDPDTAEFHMDAQAEMLLEFMDTMGHERFAMVCHDQGGAASQIIVARRPETVTCWVITDCVCYDNWPVPTIAWLQRLLRLPVLPDVLTRMGLLEFTETRTPLSLFRHSVVRGERFTDEAILEYLRPMRSGERQRLAFLKFFLAGNPRYTLRAVEGLKKFQQPTLILWAADDPHLSPSWGRRLYDDIPGAERFELVPFCGHFWQEERPAEFAAHMGEFLALHARPAADTEETHA